jgi:hypothetical protein
VQAKAMANKEGFNFKMIVITVQQKIKMFTLRSYRTLAQAAIYCLSGLSTMQGDDADYEMLAQ